MNKLVKYAIKYLIFFVIIILLILTISSIFYVGDFTTEPFRLEENEKVIIVKNNFVLVLFLLCISILIIYFLYRLSLKIRIRWLCIFVLSSIFICSIIWIIFAKNMPRDDQLAVSLTAEYLFKNHKFLHLTRGYYFWLHPYQLGFVLFLEIIFLVYNSIYFIQMMNVIFIIIIVLSLYYITQQLFNSEKSNKIIFILLFGYLYFEFISTFIYGNIPGLMFSLISIIFLNKYIKENKNKYIIFMGIFIVIANLIKPNYLIFLVAELLVILLDTIINKKIKNIAFICVILIMLNISNISVKKLYEIRSGLELARGIPKILYINMGLNNNTERANGWYDGSTIEIFRENNWDIDKAKREGNEQVKNRLMYFLNNPNEAYKFLKEKILTQWIEPTHQVIWINIPLDDFNREMNELSWNIYSQNGTLNKLFDLYFTVYQLMIYMMSTIYFIKNIKNIEYKQIVLILIFFGGFLFQIFWEAKSLYTFIFTILLLPYTANELESIFQVLDNRIKSFK